MIRATLSSCCFVLLLAGCAARATVPALGPPISESALEAHIAYLASDALEGREAGTPGCEKAERYIRAQLEAAGLDAVEEQPFEFVAGARLGERNALAVGDTPLPAESFVPLPFSRAGRGAWEAVLAGYGIEAPDLDHDDYAGVDPRGKVVVVLAGSPDGETPHGKFADHAGARAKALAAAAKGAAALVLVVFAEDERLPPFHGENVSRDVGIPVMAVKASACAPLLGIDVAALVPRLGAHEKVSRDLDRTVTLEVDVELERRTTRNILGWLRARAPDAIDELVIVGAHHDHLGRGGPGSLARKRLGEIHNGADDNASGVAGVIELARSLAPRASELRRHVLFMTFSAEEWGLLGSKHFKEHPVLRVPASRGLPAVEVRPVAMINMDMIGRMKGTRLLASGLATSPAWPDLLEKVRRGIGSPLEISGDSAKELMGSSDHVSFYQLGVPVVFFFTGNHRQYHTPDDDLYRIGEDGRRERLINLAGMVDALEFIAGVVVEVADRREELPYEEGVDLMPRMSFRVVLRLLPDYGADVDGMQVAGVTPGGPAETAGIAEGDVIVRFGDTPVHSVRDYMVGLQKAKAGEPVEVELVRAGARRTVEVRPQGVSGGH